MIGRNLKLAITSASDAVLAKTETHSYFDLEAAIGKSASEHDSGYAYGRYVDDIDYAYWSNSDKSTLFSVRCLLD